jgi:hypothetical protein
MPLHLKLEVIKFASGLEGMSSQELASLAVETFATFMGHKARMNVELRSLRASCRTLIKSSNPVKIKRVKLVVRKLRIGRVKSEGQERLVPSEIKGFELRFNSLREQIRLESLLRDRVLQIGGLPRLVNSTEQKIEWLQNMLHDTLAKAAVWCYENRYNLHTEAPVDGGALQMWVTRVQEGET